MSDFKQQISGVIHSKYENAALYTLFIGMAAGNALPSPTDALYMKLQTNLRDKWKRGELTAEKYWKLNVFYYYAVPFLWWAFLALIVINVRTTSQNKAKIALALLGSSVVLGVVLRQIQKDKNELQKEDEEKKLLVEKHPEVVKILQSPEFENISASILSSTGTDKVQMPDKLDMNLVRDINNLSKKK